MEALNKVIREILTKAEADGTLGSSGTANQILSAAKPYYSDPESQSWIDKKFEALREQPGVNFPQNWRGLLLS